VVSITAMSVEPRKIGAVAHANLSLPSIAPN
jgi:hypothetical protein